MRVKFIAGMCAVFILTGCAGQVIPISREFHPEEAKRLAAPGPNIISGSALIRQQGGGVVTCAGLPINLIPKTAYATERMEAIWGNSVKGYAPAYSMQMTFTPDPPGYHQHASHTRCDAQGNFQFPNVADGEFYLVSVITWVVARQAQGGGMMQAISVNGGEAKEVVLSP